MSWLVGLQPFSLPPNIPNKQWTDRCFAEVNGGNIWTHWVFIGLSEGEWLMAGGPCWFQYTLKSSYTRTKTFQQPSTQHFFRFFTNFDHFAEDQILRVRPSGFPPPDSLTTKLPDCFVVLGFFFSMRAECHWQQCQTFNESVDMMWDEA